MTSKDKYRKLCKDDKTIPIFSKDWWMDATCDEDNWDVLLAEKGGEIVASMPIYIKNRYGMKYITQPKLTQTNGIHIRYPKKQKYEKRLSFEKEVMNDIIDQLEDLDVVYYQQNFNYSVTNWLPFYWRGFEQTTRYTYVIKDLSDLDKVYDGFSKNTKNHLRKLKNEIEVITSDNLQIFYNINKLTFSRQSIDIPYPLEYLCKIDKACNTKKSRKIYFALDNIGNVHTAIYVIWDDYSAYLLLSGSDPKYRNNNAKIALIWEAINFVSKYTKSFDFEGSMIERIADYNKNFSTMQMPYFSISRAFKYEPFFKLYKSFR